MFSRFNFSSIFSGGQLTPFSPMCGRPCVESSQSYARSLSSELLLLLVVELSISRCLRISTSPSSPPPRSSSSSSSLELPTSSSSMRASCRALQTPPPPFSRRRPAHAWPAARGDSECGRAAATTTESTLSDDAELQYNSDSSTPFSIAPLSRSNLQIHR